MPAANVFFAINEEAFSSVSGGRVNVPAGAHHFYICVRVNVDEVTVNGDRIEVKVTPQNNFDWFNGASYTGSAVLMNRRVDSSLTVPLTFSTEEGKDGIIEGVISPALDKPANFNVKITHVTTNSTTLDGLQVSTDAGATWTNTLNNINFLLPAGSTGYLVKYFIKTNLVEEGNRYFDITVTETTTVKVLKPTVNFKTRVTVIDMTKLNYGDLISTYCNGRDLFGIYSDGNGGRYEEPIIVNAPVCGSTILPPDTVMATFCAGTTRVQHLSDGSGGYYRKVLAFNSPACEYVALPVNPIAGVTPTYLNPVRKGPTVIQNTDNDVFGALFRDNGISDFSARFGKWYFEVQVYLPTASHLEVGLGFGLTNNNLSEWIGANATSWSWWPYDSTKYHRDKQELYAHTIDVKDKDVLGVMLDMENRRFGFTINGVFQGWTFENLTDDKMHFLIAGRFDSWAFVNFGKYEFKYPVPSGFFAGFGAIPNMPAEKGTIVSYFCQGETQWVKKADGKFGTYDEQFKTNAPECGWVDPKPPAGTVIGFVCDGFDKYNKLADGNGGFTLRLVSINSTDCGYVPPSEGSLSNVLIYNAGGWIDPDVVLSGDRLSFINGKKSITVDHGNYSGIWFWELNDWSGDLYVGFHDSTSFNMDFNLWGNNGIAVEPKTGMVNNRGVKEQLFTPVAAGAPIGFKIDFKAQTITAYMGSESVVISTVLNYPTQPANQSFTPTVTNQSSALGTGTFNFGQASFHFAAASGLKPYQRPANPFPKRGTPLSFKCEHWTRYVSRGDGNGETYTELFENDSVTCGWYPDPPIGTVLGYYCIRYVRWKTVANGNYTTIDVLVQENSTECGYIPYGVVIALYCVGKDQWASKSDGNDGQYEELVRANSPNCGASAGEDDFSDQEPDPRFDMTHARQLPVVGYDIVHNKPLVP